MLSLLVERRNERESETDMFCCIKTSVLEDKFMFLKCAIMPGDADFPRIVTV